MEYLIIELVFFIIVFFVHKINKLKIFRSKLQFIVFWLITLICGIFWDNFAVWRGHWYYPGKGIVGFFIGYLPIEDYIFIVLVPYTVLVLYRLSVKYEEKMRKRKK